MRSLLVGLLAVVGCNDNGVSASNPTPAGSGLVQRNDIVSDRTDTTLINAWGLAFNPKGFAWISAAGSGLSEVYDVNGHDVIPKVTIPNPAGGTAAPTGQVFNPDANAFNGDAFIFVTEDGAIAGWQPSAGSQAILRVDNSASAIYKGVTIAGGRLFAANFHNGAVEAYDSSYHRLQTGFQDPQLPAGFAPFNVAEMNGSVIVTYAMQDADKHDDVKGAGMGYVDRYDTNGVLEGRLISAAELNSPWGVTLTPATFAAAPDRMLVGNFGDGMINVYRLEGSAAVHEGQLMNSNSTAMVIDGLWALKFGPGAGGFAADQLYFTSGPGGEMHGVFGRLSTTQAGSVGGTVTY